MTKTQKLVLIVLAVIAVSLGIGLFVLQRSTTENTPQQQGEIPIVDVELIMKFISKEGDSIIMNFTVLCHG